MDFYKLSMIEVAGSDTHDINFFFSASDQAADFSNDLHPKSKFLAIIGQLTGAAITGLARGVEIKRFSLVEWSAGVSAPAYLDPQNFLLLRKHCWENCVSV